MEKEFNLSEEECYDATGRFYYWKGEDIKEFIKIILEDFEDSEITIDVSDYPNKPGVDFVNKEEIINKIKKRAGEKLLE